MKKMVPFLTGGKRREKVAPDGLSGRIAIKSPLASKTEKKIMAELVKIVPFFISVAGFRLSLWFSGHQNYR